MGWTEERVELLKKLWADGLSASQIAAELGGITRNAVASLAKAPHSPRDTSRKAVASRRPRFLAAQAGDLFARLEALFGRMTKP